MQAAIHPAFVKNFVIFWIPSLSRGTGAFDLLLVALNLAFLLGDGAGILEGGWAALSAGDAPLFTPEDGASASSFLITPDSPPSFLATSGASSSFSFSAPGFVEDTPFPPAFAKKLAIFLLFSLLATGITNVGESFPTLPTSLETG